MRLNLAKFFSVTAVLLVLIAAGLVSSAMHTRTRRALFNDGNAQAMDLSWLVVPSTDSRSLLTGLLGFQPCPTVAEVVGWLLYAVPMLTFVLWPQHRGAARRGAAASASMAAQRHRIIGIASSPAASPAATAARPPSQRQSDGQLGRR